eukprot:2216500-Amphidinium_carterae.1
MPFLHMKFPAIADLQGMIARSVLQVATLRSKLGDAVVDRSLCCHCGVAVYVRAVPSYNDEFDEHFFAALHKKYEQLGVEEKEATVEWSVAYCEQLGIDVPDWMMNKDEVPTSASQFAKSTMGLVFAHPCWKPNSENGTLAET